MNLSEKQQHFCFLVGKLIIWANSQGYQLTFGEAWRTLEQAELNEKNEKGISNSLHRIRLAVDLNLFIKGIYQTDSNAYKPLGDFWKSLDSSCCWGGDFAKKDGNHFSLTNEGIK